MSGLLSTNLNNHYRLILSSPLGNPKKNPLLEEAIEQVSKNIFSISPEHFLLLDRKFHDSIIEKCLNANLNIEKFEKLWPYLMDEDVNQIYQKYTQYRPCIANHYLKYDSQKQEITITTNCLDAKSTADLTASFKEKEKVQNIIIKLCTRLTDLTCLRGYDHLKRVNVSKCSTLKTLEGIEGCSELQELSLNECVNVENFNPLQNLIHIEQIFAEYCLNLVDIKALSQLPKLTTLDLNLCTKLRNIQSLSGCKVLKTLKLQGAAIDNIDFAVHLPMLEQIDVTYTCVRTIPAELTRRNVEVKLSERPIQSTIEEESVLTEFDDHDSKSQ